ncbi:MAG: phage tail tape measure protein [Thermoproteota archaeon]
MSVRAEVEIVLNAIDNASREISRLSDAIEESTGKLSTLKDIAKTAAGVLLGELAHDALGAVTNALGNASKNFTSLEDTLVRITASMGKTGKEAEALRAEFQKVAEQQADLGFSAVEAAQALESLVKAGLEGEDAAKALRAALEMARIENISTSKAANLLVSTLNQFGMTAEDASKALDVLVNASMLGIGSASEFADGLSYVGTIAHQMGLSIEETTAALVAMNNAGIDASRAGRYLASMLSDLIEKGQGVVPTWDNFINLIKEGRISMEDAIKAFDKVAPSLNLGKLASEDLELAWHELTNAVEEGRISQEQIAEALKKCGLEVNKLGFEIYNADGSMKSLDEIVMELTNRLQSFGSQAERDAYLNEVFGEQGRRAATVLIQQGDAFTDLVGKMEQTGSALMMVNEIMNTTNGRMAQMNAQSQNASLGFGQLTASIQEAFVGFTTFLGPLGEVTKGLGPSLLQGAVTGLTASLPALIANWTAVSGALTSVAGVISGTLIPLLTNPLTLAILGAIALATTLYMAWQNNWFGIRDVTDSVVGFLKNMIGGFADWLKGVFDMIGGWIKGLQEWWGNLTKSFTTPTATPTPRRGYMGIEVPEKQTGGYIPETGLYWLHAGEYVVPAGESSQNITVNVNITPSPGMDVRALAEEAARRVEQRLRSVLIEPTSSSAKTKRIRIGA